MRGAVGRGGQGGRRADFWLPKQERKKARHALGRQSTDVARLVPWAPTTSVHGGRATLHSRFPCAGTCRDEVRTHETLSPRSRCHGCYI